MTPILRIGRPTFSHVLKSEWIKLFSLPAALISLIAIFAAGLIGSLFLALTLESSGAISGPNIERTMTEVTLSTVIIGQLIAGILGVMIMTVEYSSATVQPTFIAVPQRLRVLAAKAVVGFLAVTGTALCTLFAAWSLTTPLYAEFGLQAPLTASGVLLSLISSAVYLGFCALFGLGVGSVVRSTTVGTIIIFLATVLLPILVSLLPLNWFSRILRVSQLGNAGDAMSRVVADNGQFLDIWGGHISVGAGWIIASAWAILALLAGVIALRKRDV